MGNKFVVDENAAEDAFFSEVVDGRRGRAIHGGLR
jgi:hypothetical protein